MDPATLEREHRAVRRAAGLFDLSARGRLEVAGPDRVAWLHNLLTNDIKALHAGQGCYAALLTPKGHVLGDLYVLAFPNTLLLDCEPPLAATLPAALGRYRVTEQVELRDRTRESGMLSVQGPRALDFLEQWAGADACPTEELRHVTYDLDGMTVLIIRCGLLGDPGFHGVVPAGQLMELRERLLTAGRPFGLIPCGPAAWESLRIEAGRPRYGLDMDDSTLLPEAGLDHAVSHTKGCYVGQEFVVRIRDRGQVTRQLALVALTRPVAARHGDRVTAGDREVGVVTSSAVVPTQGRALALAMLRRECLAPGTAVTVHLTDGPCDATVIQPIIARP